MFKKIISFFISFCFVFEQVGFAQIAGQLDISARMSNMYSSMVFEKYRPLHLRYLSYDQLNNDFKLLLDKGSTKENKSEVLEKAASDLLKYFFIGIALPNDVFWVNLRPDSPKEIINDDLAKTDIGKIMLECDLQLKKDTAKYTSPETFQGKEYWNKLYKRAEELYGREDITIPTLTRPWIVPDEIIVREAKGSAYIYKATLKVMLEQDYLKGNSNFSFPDEKSKILNEYSSQIIRETIIPKLTREINSSKRYAPLRQVYYSLILAQWFKQSHKGAKSQVSSKIDAKDLTDLTSRAKWDKGTYFKAYQKSFKDGEYNIKENRSNVYGQTIRSYFSGGTTFNSIGNVMGIDKMNPKNELSFISWKKETVPNYLVSIAGNGNGEIAKITNNAEEIKTESKLPGGGETESIKNLGDQLKASSERLAELRNNMPRTNNEGEGYEYSARYGREMAGLEAQIRSSLSRAQELFGAKQNRLKALEDGMPGTNNQGEGYEYSARYGREIASLRAEKEALNNLINKGSLILPDGGDIDKLKGLLQDKVFAEEMANYLNDKYNEAQPENQRYALYGEKDITTPSGTTKKDVAIAMNVAGFYALETAVGALRESSNRQEQSIVQVLTDIANGKLSEQENNLVMRFANATWKAGQPFRDINRITRGAFTLWDSLSREEKDKDMVQVKNAAGKVLEKMNGLENNPANQEAKLKELLQDKVFAEEMANYLNDKYNEAQPENQRYALYGEKDITTPSGTTKKDVAIAMNVAGFYALETAVGALRESSNRQEQSIVQVLTDIANGKLSEQENNLVMRFANATWKAGQPFRDINRITRGAFTLWDSLSREEKDKDMVQVKNAAGKVLEKIGNVGTKDGGDRRGELEDENGIVPGFNAKRLEKEAELIKDNPRYTGSFARSMLDGLTADDDLQVRVDAYNELADERLGKGMGRRKEIVNGEERWEDPFRDGGKLVTPQQTQKADTNTKGPLGGIDFRTLPIITQPMGELLMKEIINMPKINIADLDQEWQAMQKMIEADACPSTMRIKEFLGACYQKGELKQRADKVLACLAGILRMEEDEGKTTEPQMKVMLALLEYNG